jgi:hypothetical protein
VQKRCLLEVCEKIKDGKKRKAQKPGKRPGLRQNKTAMDWKPRIRNEQRQSERLRSREPAKNSRAKGAAETKKLQWIGNQGEGTNSGRVRD